PTAAAAVLRHRLRAIARPDPVLLLAPHPGQLAPLAREPVAEPRVLLLASEQPFSRGKPLLAASHLVISHALALLSYAPVLPTTAVHPKPHRMRPLVRPALTRSFGGRRRPRRRSRRSRGDPR